MRLIRQQGCFRLGGPLPKVMTPCERQPASYITSVQTSAYICRTGSQQLLSVSWCKRYTYTKYPSIEIEGSNRHSRITSHTEPYNPLV